MDGEMESDSFSANSCRRTLLLTSLALGVLLACQSEKGRSATPTPTPTPTPTRVLASASAPQSRLARSAEDWGGLEVARTGALREDERGGELVVLLHGFGAKGDDLLPLARALGRPGVRFLLPAAPRDQGNGRAWWSLNPPDRPAHAWTDALPAGHQEHRQVQAAREAVQALLRRAKERYAPTRVALVGFSQGAMLALHVALSGEPPVDRVAALSGVLLADSLPALRSRAIRRPAVFVAHGRQDPVLGFGGGERIQSILVAHGVPVTFHAFEGGHQIPGEVVQQLRSFLMR